MKVDLILDRPHFKKRMNKTNFDVFLEEALRDPDFAERFERAGDAWDVALQIAPSRMLNELPQKNTKEHKEKRPRRG
jgi:hypothetical protein